MWRTLMATAIVYLCGQPALDRVRPSFLDKPLQGFHADVNLAVQDGRHILSSLSDARALHYVSDYFALLSSKFHSDK
jgi:hypothetical protein